MVSTISHPIAAWVHGIVMPLTFGSLFAGNGGIDLGFERAGLVCKWQVEIDDYAQKVLAKHWPEVHQERDIRQCGVHNLKYVDVIAGGFPCQDISYAGRGAGLDGERSGLFFEAIRVDRELQPRFVVLENVAALLTRGLDRVLGTLAEIGYDAEWHCIPAAAVGAPHIRDRVFVIGTLNTDSNSVGLRQNAEQWSKQQGADDSRNCGAEYSNSSANVANTNVQHGQRGAEPRQSECDPGQARAEFSGCGEDVADANKSCTSKKRLQRSREFLRVGCDQATNPQRRSNSYWAGEPAVGRTIDGFSKWLDGNRGLICESHKRIMAYVITQTGDRHANAKKKRSEQVLQDLRNAVDPHGFQWATGGLVGVSSQEVLFAYLCKHTQSTANEAWLQLQSKKASEGSMRGLRTQQEPSSSSYRPAKFKQCSRKHPDSLQALSRLLAHDSREAWIKYCGEDASPILSEWGRGWESNVSRVAHGIPARVDRLRGLGNAVVPQVAEWIGRRLVELA